MDEPDYDINNYSIEDMKSLLGIQDIFDTERIYEITNAYILLSETKNNKKMAKLFKDIQIFLTSYTKSVLSSRSSNSASNPSSSSIESINPDDWMSPVLSQTSAGQLNKITNREQKINVYDNEHVPMKSQQLGVSNTYNVPVVQDKLNPNLKNSYNRFIVLDSQYRQGSNGGVSTDYLADLSDIMNKVLSISLYSIQIPCSWYIIDSNYLNNYFVIQLTMTGGTSPTNVVTIEVPSGNYTVTSLVSELNTQLTAATITHVVFDYLPISSNIEIICSPGMTYQGNSVSMVNMVWYESNWSAASGIPFSFNQTLGWYLGYRNIIYNGLSNTTLIAEAVIDLLGPRYLILSIDDFNQNRINNGLVTITETSKHLKIPEYYQSSAVYSSTIYGQTLEQSAQEVANNGGDGNILNYADKMGTSYKQTQLVGVGPDGKQTLTQSQIYTINEILKNNSLTTTYRNLAPTTPDVLAIIPVKPGTTGRLYVDFSGSLKDNKRVYFGPVDIERLKIKLYNDRGQILNLNGLDWSFTLSAELLYQY